MKTIGVVSRDRQRLRMPRPTRHAMATAFGCIDAGTIFRPGLRNVSVYA
jgi:hypothetical protein